MTFFDYFIMAVFLASVLLGFWRGMVSEVITLVGWILAFVLARRLGGLLGSYLEAHLPNPAWQAVLGWLLVFIGVLFATALLRFGFRNLLKALGLGIADRVFGLFFGAIRGCILLLFMTVIVGMTPLPLQPWWQLSVSTPYLEKSIQMATPWLPAEINHRIRFN